MNKLKLVLFLCFSIIIPIGYLVVRYGLFQPTTTIQVGLLGIVVFAILIGSVEVLIKYYLESMKAKYSLFKQILNGLIKLILPLTLCLLVIITLDNNIGILKEALIIIIICESVAIIINPFPQWCFENNIEGLGEIVEKIGFKKEGGN